jgi:hypothetical protein
MYCTPKCQISCKSVKRFSDCDLRNTNWEINFNVRRRKGKISFLIYNMDRQINFNMAETNGHVNFNVHPEEIRLSENTEQPHKFKISNLKKYLFCMNLEGVLSLRYSRIVLTERLIANDGLNSSWKEVVLTYFIAICRRYWGDWKKPWTTKVIVAGLRTGIWNQVLKNTKMTS